MDLELVPMLRVARDLYDVPRGPERFQAYIRTMTSGPDDATLPLVSLNPMGREHVAAALDALLALDAEAIATSAAADAARRLRHVEGTLRVGLTLADDVAGGWTHRSLTDMAHRFDLSAALKRQWAVALFWASEMPSPETVRAEVLGTIYRSAYALRHGTPKTLRAMLVQEGLTGRFAGLAAPDWTPDEREAVRAVVEPRRESVDTPVIFACLYGDAAAREVGYPPLGLPPNAGFNLAIAEAQAIDAPLEALVTSGQR